MLTCSRTICSAKSHPPRALATTSPTSSTTRAPSPRAYKATVSPTPRHVPHDAPDPLIASPSTTLAQPPIMPRSSRYFHTHDKLHYFPIIASVSWFSTLTILLLRWVAVGQPRYPGQVNPSIPFISDIAAFTFKPVFVIGCSVTAVCFVGTVYSVHHVRYSSSFYGLVDDAIWRKTLSGVAMFSGLVAGSCLLLLSIFDTFEEHDKHKWLLVGTFGSLAISSLTTEIVWWDETYKAARFPGLRKWCLANNFLVLAIVGVGTTFMVFLYTDYYSRAGYLEWTITYLGSLWLGTFAGYIRFREEGGVARHNTAEDGESQPLLAPEIP